MPTSRYERAARRAGYRAIAGLDEAGRGALFGPVFAAAVVLDPDRPIRGLDDSKQLDPERREVLAERIRRARPGLGRGRRRRLRNRYRNILEAARLAMRRAVDRLNAKLMSGARRSQREQAPALAGCGKRRIEGDRPLCPRPLLTADELVTEGDREVCPLRSGDAESAAMRPAGRDYLLVDALHLDLDLPQKALIHGDSLCFSIAAASILAKVERDAALTAWDSVFPEYGLARK